METNLDLKKIWGKQYIPIIDVQEVLKKIETYKRSKIKKAVMLNVLLFLTILFILFIWVYFKPQFISTKIGIVLTVVAMLIVIFFNSKMKNTLSKLNENQSNEAYLKNLKTIKLNENRIQTKVMSLYFVLLSFGIMLYIYEYISKMTPVIQSVFCLALVLWIAFNWFVLRPRIIKKNQREINDLIAQLERIENQFIEE
ncbi:MAG: hypothetical protein RSD30_17815 [Flavobacterium sp.]